MFKVTFVKYVFDSDHGDPKARFAVLFREEILPFAPQVGIEIIWPMEKNQRIVECAWVAENKAFRCRVEDFYALNFNIDVPNFDDFLDDSFDTGWSTQSTYAAE